MKRLIIEPEAIADLEQANEWYAAEGESLKLRFVAAIEHAIHRARDRPTSFRFVHSLTRGVRADPFPYAVPFQDRPEATIVLGVMHTSRDPDAFLRRSR